MMDTIRVGLVQQRCTDNRQENIDNSIDGIRRGRSPGRPAGRAAGTALRPLFLPDRGHGLL